MIPANCFICGDDLVEPGGLLFSPPCNDMCEKLHLCKNCYEKTKLVMQQMAGFVNRIKGTPLEGLK